MTTISAALAVAGGLQIALAVAMRPADGPVDYRYETPDETGSELFLGGCLTLALAAAWLCYRLLT